VTYQFDPAGNAFTSATVWRCMLIPVEPSVESAGSHRLKLNCDEPLSNVALNFKLQRYAPERLSAGGLVEVVAGLGKLDAVAFVMAKKS